MPLLTSLRFFAAAIVLTYHVYAPDPQGGFLQGIAASGTQAVSFFFILSGFILTYVYSARDEKGALIAVPVRFWHARLARIAPAYMLGLVIATPIFLYSTFVLKSVSVPTFLIALFLVPLFLQAWWPSTIFAWNVPAWSVSIEAFFYVLFPFLERVARLLAPLMFLLMAVLLICAVDLLKDALRPAPDAPPERWNIMYFPPLHLSLFVLGMALGRVFLFGPAIPALIHKALFWLGVILSVAFLGFRASLPAWFIQDAMLSLAFGAVIFGGAFATGASFLRSRLMLNLGEASYSLYITHYPLMFLWRSALRNLQEIPGWLSNILFCLFAVSVSLGIYAYIERPWRRRLLGHAPHG